MTIPNAEAPRFDMYTVIHKALRHRMGDTLFKLGAVDPHDDDDLSSTLARVESLLAALSSHLRHENDFVHTAIEARRPGGARRTADDHLGHVEAIESLADEVDALRAAAPARRPLLALRLYRHLAVFVGENLEHMHVEETQNQAMLWELYTDAELIEIHDRLLASVPPAEMAETVHWIAPSLAPHELAAIMGGMRDGAPPPAFRAMMDAVRPTLSAARWSRLCSALGVPAAAGSVAVAAAS